MPVTSARIDDVVKVPKDVVMANKAVLDVAEGVGALAADLIDYVEDAGLDPQTGS